MDGRHLTPESYWKSFLSAVMTEVSERRWCKRTLLFLLLVGAEGYLRQHSAAAQMHQQHVPATCETAVQWLRVVGTSRCRPDETAWQGDRSYRSAIKGRKMAESGRLITSTATDARCRVAG